MGGSALTGILRLIVAPLLCALPAAGAATPSPTPTSTPIVRRVVPDPKPLARTPRRAVAAPRTADAGVVAGIAAPVLSPIPSPLVVGAANTVTGSGFTSGSVVMVFVNIGIGVPAFGPFTPTTATPTSLTWTIPTSVTLGNGFASVVVVNTDQNFIQSNSQSQYLFGSAAANIPTITSINGVGLRPLDATVPVAAIETVVGIPSTATIRGTGFNTPLVNLFTGTGVVGPLTPLPGGTSTQIQVPVPAGTATGPGTFQVVNNPYGSQNASNSVSLALGAALGITSIVQSGSTVTVTGSGFSALSVINLFNLQGSIARFLGGYWPTTGQPRVPFTTLSPTQFTFTVPPDAMTGLAYLQLVNPPFIPFSTSGSDPDGAFTINNPTVSAGGWSLRFFGTGSGDTDRVKIPLGTTDPGLPVDVGGSFTVEFWLKVAAGNQTGSCTPSESVGDGWINGNIVIDRDVFGAGDDGDYGISLYESGGWKVAYGVARGNAGATICGTTALSATGWNHIAVTRNAADGQIRLFVNGVADGIASGETGDVGYDNGRPTSLPSSDPFLVVGAEKHDVALPFSGFVDELRISNSVRYSGGFTPPVAPFVTDLSTAALYHFDEGNGNVISDSASAAGGPSPGARRFGGLPSPGPHWATDTPFPFAVPTLTLQSLGITVNDPTTITHCGDNRLFIASQSGSIFIWNGSQLLATPFLTLPSLSTGGERGLLGLAFHPLYAFNRLFYVNYTDTNGNTVVARYQTSGDPNVADPNSGVPLLQISQPAANHNGGHLAFGTDGYLYVGVGDGGGCCDNAGAGNQAQRDDTLLGKMLRIDVDHPDPGLAYGIPDDNPFVGPGAPLDEIWAKGFRNPWHYAFDRLTGGLFIGDVGQGSREEVDYQAAGVGGQNYGWRLAEGFLCSTCQNTSTCASTSAACSNPALTSPILDYSHALGCSITGGVAYRGTKIPNLYGKYLYGDLCQGRIWWARENLGTWTGTQFAPTAGSLYTFGEDVWGEVYLGRGGSTDAIYRLAP